MTAKPDTKADNPFAEYRRYNRYGVLRVRWPFWLVTVLLVRHLLLIMMIGLSHRGAAGSSMGTMAALIDPKFIAADGPALILLITLGARMPKSGALARFLWHQGRMLMTLSIAIFLGTLVWQKGVVPTHYTLAEAGQIGGNLVLLIYVWLSRYLRDLFAQFPAPDADSNPPLPLR